MTMIKTARKNTTLYYNVKRIKLLLITLCITVLSYGCKNIAPVTSGTGTDNISPGQEFVEHLQLDNKELSEKVHISKLLTRTTNDLLEINLTLKSSYKKTLKLQYQFTWFDKYGFVIEPGKSPWKPLDLHGMQFVDVAALAPTEAVATFKIYVREVPEEFFKF